MIRFISLLCLVILSACLNTPYKETRALYYSKKGIQLPEQGQFQHCRNYGCKTIETLRLNDEQWAQINAIFSPPPQNARQEREKIRQAMGLFERITGEITGSKADKGGTFKTIGTNQLDCIDESTNTTTYLILLKQNNLITFHDISSPATRLPLFGGGNWAHQTAVIVNLETQKPFAVDSWFRDNGAPADIVPLKQWHNGWRPQRQFPSSR